MKIWVIELRKKRTRKWSISTSYIFLTKEEAVVWAEQYISSDYAYRAIAYVHEESNNG